jgi:hypothetical protein
VEQRDIGDELMVVMAGWVHGQKQLPGVKRPRRHTEQVVLVASGSWRLVTPLIEENTVDGEAEALENDLGWLEAWWRGSSRRRRHDSERGAHGAEARRGRTKRATHPWLRLGTVMSG